MGQQVIDRFAGEYSFLSNFYECEVEYEGLTYRSSEAAFQAAKVLEDTPDATRDAREEFTTITASQSKRLGRQIKLRSNWDSLRDGIMLEILRNKFTRNVELREKLIGTGDATLIEGTTWHDNYWGECSCPKCVNKPKHNKLGKLLMKVRLEFQSNN